MQRAASERTAWVRGAGPTGSLAALALAEAGWRVHLLDPQTPEQLLQRRRAYALTHSTQELLIQLKLLAVFTALHISFGLLTEFVRRARLSLSR